MPHFRKAADILNKYPIKYVVSTNTMGNALIVDPETESAVIAPKGGFGGLAGGFIKHTALANVRQMSQLLRPDIDVVGVGGVSSGTDAFELILCGAKAVQVGTCHRVEGPECFDRISAELKAIMKRKGYQSIEDFRGKLKPNQGAKKDGHVKKKVQANQNGIVIQPLTLLVAILVLVVGFIFSRPKLCQGL